MKTIKIFAALAAVGALSACATVTRGSTEDVQFISNPPGATVKIGLGQSCVTPCFIKVERRDTFQAVFTLGDQTEQVFVDTEVAGGGVAGVAGNVLLGGVIGVGVDVATGAGLDHVPNPVVVTFDLSKATTAEDAPATPEPTAAEEP